MAENNKNIIHLVLKDGTVIIETRPDLAPKHVAQIKQLISEKQYDGVVFHRVIKKYLYTSLFAGNIICSRIWQKSRIP